MLMSWARASTGLIMHEIFFDLSNKLWYICRKWNVPLSLCWKLEDSVWEWGKSVIVRFYIRPHTREWSLYFYSCTNEVFDIVSLPIGCDLWWKKRRKQISEWVSEILWNTQLFFFFLLYTAQLFKRKSREFPLLTCFRQLEQIHQLHSRVYFLFIYSENDWECIKVW